MPMLSFRSLTLDTPGGLPTQALEIHGCLVHALRSNTLEYYILLNRRKVQEVDLCTHGSIYTYKNIRVVQVKHRHMRQQCQ
jgi:hypothetical protein